MGRLILTQRPRDDCRTLSHADETQTLGTIALLNQRIDSLQDNLDATAVQCAGLVDLEIAYPLIENKLRVVADILSLSAINADMMQCAKGHAKSALQLIEGLNEANISIDQIHVVNGSPEMHRIRELFANIILSGGGPLFDAAVDYHDADAREIGALLESAVLRHCRPEPTFDVNPGDERIMESERMTLPRSQAVHLIREELLPALHKRLEQNPGDSALQKRICDLQDTVEDLVSMKYFPNARPPSFEKDLFTSSLAGFTNDGEPLITVEAPVLTSTGNRYDRLRDFIKHDVITGIAGKGLHSETDGRLQTAKRADSGKRGSWGDTRSKLHIDELFRDLTMNYPFLKRIDDERELTLLAEFGIRGKYRELSQRVHTMIRKDKNYLMATQPLEIESDKKKPSGS